MGENAEKSPGYSVDGSKCKVNTEERERIKDAIAGGNCWFTNAVPADLRDARRKLISNHYRPIGGDTRRKDSGAWEYRKRKREGQKKRIGEAGPIKSYRA